MLSHAWATYIYVYVYILSWSYIRNMNACITFTRLVYICTCACIIRRIISTYNIIVARVEASQPTSRSKAQLISIEIETDIS